MRMTREGPLFLNCSAPGRRLLAVHRVTWTGSDAGMPSSTVLNVEVATDKSFAAKTMARTYQVGAWLLLNRVRRVWLHPFPWVLPLHTPGHLQQRHGLHMQV